MQETIVSILNTWNVTKTERQKLQYSYLFLVVIIVIVAGIISLFNANAGHNVVCLALVAAGAFVVNAIVWNLLQASLLEKLSTKPKRR